MAATIVATHERATAAERILRAAGVLFRERGYHGSSMRTLARALRMEAASLYYHFRSKQEILFAILDRTLDDLLAGVGRAVASADGPEARLRAAVRFHVLFHTDSQHEAFLSHSELRSLTQANLRLVLTRRDEYERVFRGLLASGVRAGVFQVADDQWMLAKVAGEEIDHFRKINRLLNELGDDASELMYVEKSRRDLEAFRQAMPTWADVAAFGFLIDRVGQYQLEEFVGCSYLPLDRALPKILSEEKTHVGYGHVKLRDMVRTEEGRAAAQAAIDRWYPRGLDMFGRSNSRRAARYRYWGLKRRANETARAEYVAEVTPLIEGLGLAVPDAASDRHFV